MKKVIVFIGTRPEAIKLIPVIRVLKDTSGVDLIVISTGQHQTLLKQVIDLYGIKIDFDLNVMQLDQKLASLSAHLLTRIDELLTTIEPDMALVQGDTTTVFIAALCCFYQRIPVAHVEAGLRTSNIWSPFPEEANRRLATPLTTLHFPPTEVGRQNLLREGIDDSNITVTGNTVIDTLLMEVNRQTSPAAKTTVHQRLARLLTEDWNAKPYVLITGHRRENFGGGFKQICQALAMLAVRFDNYNFIYPVHLNPNVQQPVYEQLGHLANVKLIPPVDYSEFVALMVGSKLILTDSGGVQEEAPSLGKPVLVMRDTTERPEGVKAGVVRLVGANTEQIIQNTTELLTDEAAYRRMSRSVNLYGDGQAATRIVLKIQQYFNMKH